MIAKVVLIGIVLVFLILLLLTVLLIIFPLFFSKKNKQNTSKDTLNNDVSEIVKSDKIVIENNNDVDDYTLISVITAAIATYRQSIGESADLSSFKVVAFRKAKRR